MAGGTTAEKKGLDRRTSLEGIPFLNPGVAVSERDDGKLLVKTTIRRRSGFLARFLPESLTRQYKLDELGSFVIREIDGKKNTEEIIDDFVARFRTNRREAELSVVQFLKMLLERQVVSIAIK